MLKFIARRFLNYLVLVFIATSLRLLLLGTIFGAAGGVLIGVIGAVRQRRPADVAGTVNFGSFGFADKDYTVIGFKK